MPICNNGARGVAKTAVEREVDRSLFWVVAMLIIAFILGTSALTVGCFLFFQLFREADPHDDSVELSKSLVFRIAALHALLLGLVFAQEIQQSSRLSDYELEEANAVAATYYEAARLSNQRVSQAVSESLISYVEIAACREWDGLAAGDSLLTEAWDSRRDAYLTLLDFEPATRRDEALREKMIDALLTLEETRNSRAASGLPSVTPIFWVPAFLGLCVIASLYAVFPASWRRCVQIGIFGGFNGLVLLMIYALANPYKAPGAVEPIHLKTLVTADAELRADPRLSCILER